MAKRQSIKRQLRVELYRQFDNGRMYNRHELKAETRQFAQYDVISSNRSLEVHISHSKMFANWIMENRPDVRNMADIDRSVATEYLRYRDDNFSAKTVSADLTFINHIIVPVDPKSETQPLTKAEIGLTLNSHEQITKNRGIQNDSNTRVLFPSHEKLIEFGRTFGMRRSELVPTKSYKNYAVTEKSLYEKEGRVYLCTFGKGGRYRVVEALKSQEQWLRENYGDIIQPVSELPPASEFKAIQRQSDQLFESCSRSIPIHVVCRQYYANQKLQEFQEEGRSWYVLPQNETKSGIDTYTTNGVEMSRDAAQFVSQQLGHNRIHELKSYINVNVPE